MVEPPPGDGQLEQFGTGFSPGGRFWQASGFGQHSEAPSSGFVKTIGQTSRPLHAVCRAPTGTRLSCTGFGRSPLTISVTLRCVLDQLYSNSYPQLADYGKIGIGAPSAPSGGQVVLSDREEPLVADLRKMLLEGP